MRPRCLIFWKYAYDVSIVQKVAPDDSRKKHSNLANNF